MDLIALAIMGRAIAPTGAKRAKLQSTPSTRVLAPQTSHRTSLTDSACSIAVIFIENLLPRYMYAFVYLAHDTPVDALLGGGDVLPQIRPFGAPDPQQNSAVVCT